MPIHITNAQISQNDRIKKHRKQIRKRKILEEQKRKSKPRSLLYGGKNGIQIYSSTLRDVLLQGQNELGGHHYVEPYLLQAMRLTFKRLMRKGDWIFVVKRDIYSPNNVSVKHLVKCFPRFAQAYIRVRNGEHYPDYKIPDDINYAELFDQYNHSRIEVFNPRGSLTPALKDV